jgi:hypothetical protein
MEWIERIEWIEWIRRIARIEQIAQIDRDALTGGPVPAGRPLARRSYCRSIVASTPAK